ncbi:hypothetical protein C8F01DRAFT_1260803 [Mycena amicta]|nr:hypothetical protein C8F01DRAFT_1260803 [Mycena amicta]
MAPLAARHTLFPLDNILGACLIGLVLSSCIFGITTLQVYLYFTKFSRRDGAVLKSFVGALLVIDTIHLVLVTTSVYSTSVTNFGDYTTIIHPPSTLIAQVVVGVVLGAMVQVFYAYRIWLLSEKSLYIPVLVVLCSCGELAMSIVYTKKAFEVRLIPTGNDRQQVPYSTAGLALEVTCDVLISGGMVYNLRKHKSSFSRTTRALNLLVAYTINSGILTMHDLCDLQSGYFYGCSFMSILNSRDYVRKQMHGPSSQAMVTIPQYSGSVGNDSTLPGDGSKNDPAVARSQSTGMVVFEHKTSEDYMHASA